MHAPYTLNKKEQLSTLAKHSSLCDFEIDVTNAHNTNIQCSAGFYEAVPKPALTVLKEGFQASISGTLVSCIESRAKRDQLGRNDNHLLRFLVAIDGAGTAVVHLHHTQQLVQVQGSGSQWLVNNFIKHIFLVEAERKRLLISDLNKVFDAAGKGLENQINSDYDSCKHCLVKFRKNSKPAVCGNCGCHFHNTKINKCFLSHNCRSPPATSSSFSPCMSAAPLQPTRSDQMTIPSLSPMGSSMAITFVPATTCTTTTTTQFCSSPISTPSATTSAENMTNASLEPSHHVQHRTVAREFCSSASSSSTVTALTPTSVVNPVSPVQPQPKSNLKNNVKTSSSNQSKSVQEAEISILKQELI